VISSATWKSPSLDPLPGGREPSAGVTVEENVVSCGSRENPGFFASVDIMWQELGIAFCLLLVLEGILPFLCPRLWREAAAQLARLSDRRLRLMGLTSMLLGTALLYLLH
jgi:hypothetical protein